LIRVLPLPFFAMRASVFFVFIFFNTYIYASKLTLTNIQEREFDKKGLVYLIKAHKKEMDFEKLRHFHIFNRQKYVSEAIHYMNGTLHKKNIRVDFEYAYFYEGNLYMKNCYAIYKNGNIKSKSAIYKQDYIEFHKLILKEKNKIYHKFKYIFKTK